MSPTLLFLLICSACSGSLGASISTYNGTLPQLLSGLANNCGNVFLASQTLSKISDCNVTFGKGLREKQFQCLIFYDINKQLCNAVATSKLNITNGQESKINQELNLANFCEGSKEWKVMDLPEYPEYTVTAENVFHNSIWCAKACGDDDVTSQNTNFYCKYYKWGKDILQSLVTTSTSKSNNTSNDDVVEPNYDIPPIPTGDNPPEIAVTPHAKEIAATTSNVNKENTKDQQEQPDNINKDTVAPKVDGKGANSSDVPLPERKGNGPETKPENRNSHPSGVVLKENDGNKDKDEMNDDYGDSQDQGGDDDDDSNLDIMDLGKRYKDQIVKSNNKIKNTDEQSLLPNMVQDTLTEDGDDHFFSFFLTVIVIVVALYIIYHNKNKLSKMFLGLIVEGRQSGRRRNSRGHAYRRLDTLEQAMSANTAAPPSKIIY